MDPKTVNSRNIWERQFWEYVNQSPVPMEVTDEPLYATNFYVSGKTTALSFFDQTFRHSSLSNSWMIGMLPNPMAFLVEEIRIEGITQNIRYGACTLQIGSKHYMTSPAWTFGLKERGFKLKMPLLIAPLQCFRFTIQWETAERLGKGISGLDIRVKPIQVVLFGLKARAVA